MNKIKTIAVVGGGSSGWMTALALRNKLPNVKIKLIEDPSIGAIGVGESTTPPVVHFIKNMLELNPEDWMPHTNASFKVGTEFVGWSDEKFYSTFKVMDDYDQTKESWFIKKINYPETPLANFFESIFPSVTMIQEDKFEIDLNKNAWAVHFNAGMFGEYLKNVSITKGVDYIEGRVDTIQKDNIGNITSITLLDNNCVEADLFVDCTGFGSVLAKSYDNEFLSVDEFLPNNKALVVRKPRNEDEEISVCTRANTGTAGWIWEIPMRTETAIGYVHCPDFISLEDAKAELLEFSGMPSDTPIQDVNFRSGRFDKQWVKNCVSIGLSGGFLEPLESTGLWFTVHSINMLVDSLSQVEDQICYHNPIRAVFNEEFADQFDSVSSFIQLHFIGAHRNDTPYWKYVTEELEGNEDMVNGLLNVLHNGPHTYIPGFFETYLWSGITMGLGLTTAGQWLGRYNKESEDQSWIDRLDAHSSMMRQAIRGMKSHRVFLEEFLHD